MTTENPNPYGEAPKTVEDEHYKGAVRAFLQRGETRISTLQRIGGVFLNGAGLLVLLPVFTRETFTSLLKIIIHLPYHVSIPLLFVLLITLLIPLYALYLLFKDIVHFYFTPYHPGFEDAKFFPRFILSGLALPLDDTKAGKDKVIEKELTDDMINLLISPNNKVKGYKDTDIIPKTRAFNTKECIIPKNLINKIESNGNQSTALNKDKVDLFHIKFGLAAVVDRDLAEEVAKMEISMVRHIYHLRRLILRYIKALLILIWTTLIVGMIASYLNDILDTAKNTIQVSSHTLVLILSFGFLIWAVTLPMIVRAPINWIYQQDNQNKKKDIKDDELVHFEEVVILGTVAAFFGSAMALVCELWYRIPSNLFIFTCLAVICTLAFALVPASQRTVLIGFYKRKTKGDT